LNYGCRIPLPVWKGLQIYRKVLNKKRPSR